MTRLGSVSGGPPSAPAGRCEASPRPHIASRGVSWLSLLALPLIALTACRPATADLSLDRVTEGGRQRVALACDETPIPLNRIHSWTATVQTADGRPVRDAVVTIDGGMPEHQHGLPTVPEVTPLGDGRYRIEGMKFSMPGHWVLRLDVWEGGKRDRVSFDLVLP